MQELMKNIGYNFNNINLLKTALTHSSYANEHGTESYERLEFLGDSILSFVVSSRLYESDKTFQEGDMSKIRASIVCERSLDECSRRLNIGKKLILSKGEELTGGRTRASILADVFEAILAAIYLDSGYENAEEFVLSQLGDAIEKGRKGYKLYSDYKTELQESAQANNEKVEYKHIREDGPAHERIFTVQVLCNDVVLAEGVGRTKKEAEQNAARLAIKEVNNVKV